jgi:hypothetical protein
MHRYVWHSHYVAAILAPMPSQNLISVAENAISARLQDSSSGDISPDELNAAKYALIQLRCLKTLVEEH